MAKEWHTSYQAREHGQMSRLPADVAHDSAATMWEDSVSEGAARAEGTAFMKKYTDDMQFVFCRCHHHHHRWDSKKKRFVPPIR